MADLPAVSYCLVKAAMRVFSRNKYAYTASRLRLLSSYLGNVGGHGDWVVRPRDRLRSVAVHKHSLPKFQI
jgi:hypothetical protein